MSVQFNVKTASSALVQKLSRELQLPDFICNVLATRGIDTPDKAVAFFNPQLEYDWGNPYDLPGMYELVNTVEQAIRNKKHILVFGDFDLDGISATAIVTRCLRLVGAHVTPYIPHRFEEGYSITQEAIDRIMCMPVVPDLIVTVDCGISCKHEVAKLLELGIDVCITDHHEPADLVPEGVPVVDPKMTGPTEDAILAGVGVALKFVQALGARFGFPHFWKELTDFATLGTVADLMPMIGENRALVRNGLRKMNSHLRPCLAALFSTVGATGDISSTSLSFSVIPRLNAAGRMGDASLALNLLLSDNLDESLHLSQQLEDINTKRRQIESDLAAIAKEQAEQVYQGQRALVVAGENWHEGVKGIVASRLVNTYGVPALLFSIENGEARGSGRSIGKINLFKAIESCSDLLIRYGGHEAAVGLTLPANKLPEFYERLCAYLDTMPKDAFHPPIEIDSVVKLSELTLENVRMLDKLAPFGHENAVPVFLAQNVILTNKKAVGAEKNHFSCALSDGIATTAAIMFNCSNIDTLMQAESVVSAAFTLQVDEWRGRFTVKAMLKNVTPARSCAALEACLSPRAVSFVSNLYAESNDEQESGLLESNEEVSHFEDGFATNREKWEAIARNNPSQLRNEIVQAVIGNNALHTAQIEVLNGLAEGGSVFSIMATGRGKSLTFQVEAAISALRDHKASVFIYPLRALIVDQYYHLNTIMQRFGIRSSVLTGESSQVERKQVFEELNNGSLDIVLTTPEFFVFHVEKFKACGRIGFIAIDEAHHMSKSEVAHRPAYAELGAVIKQLNHPRILALTATANDSIADQIVQELKCDISVYDSSSRPNLHIDDHRFVRNREDYLAHIVARGEKTIVYVNSRSESIALARKLRQRVPQLSSQIGFYNAGLSRHERSIAEELFRTGGFCTLVSTSAFGEGVNIDDVRHVVLYNLPFNDIEFNQMSGRVGRDGKPAVIHLLYNKDDQTANNHLLLDTTPNREVLASLYRTFRSLQRLTPHQSFVIDASDFSVQVDGKLIRYSGQAVRCGISVFRELGLLSASPAASYGFDAWEIQVFETSDKVNLQDSVRLQEGLGELEEFRQFCKWAFEADSVELLKRISSPIVPKL